MAARHNRQPAGRRRGPVPLPLHLSLAWMTWNGSRTGLALWRNVLPSLNPAGSPNPNLAEQAKALHRKLQELAKSRPQNDREQSPRHANSGLWADFEATLGNEIALRLEAFQKGIAAYRAHPYRRDMPAPMTLWKDGSSRLFDFGKEGGKVGGKEGALPVLFVPSLINRGYILDLLPDRSLLRWLGADDLALPPLRPLALEWGAPGEIERNFTLTDYVRQRLEPALDVAVALAGGPVPLVGYCMGGLVALALALRHPDKISSLALLATPWDFHAEPSAQAAVPRSLGAICRPMIDVFGELPVEALQALFCTLDPFLVPRKFRTFAGVDLDGERAREFVALEDWLNDGVALAGPVALECLQGWYRDNTPMNRAWRVADRVVDPGELNMPTLLLVPRADRIVPPRSALGLATQIPHAQTMEPALGHIGMVASRRAVTKVWEPLRDWLTRNSI